jgi:hypothetical protein
MFGHSKTSVEQPLASTPGTGVFGDSVKPTGDLEGGEHCVQALAAALGGVGRSRLKVKVALHWMTAKTMSSTEGIRKVFSSFTVEQLVKGIFRRIRELKMKQCGVVEPGSNVNVNVVANGAGVGFYGPDFRHGRDPRYTISYQFPGAFPNPFSSRF